MFIPRWWTSSLMVKPRDEWAVRKARMLTARLAAGAARAMSTRYRYLLDTIQILL
jgi:hypothetical protein